MPMLKRTCVCWGALLTLLPLLAGCTSQKTKVQDANRDAVSGTVTFDGKPLPLGTITCISVKDPMYKTTAAIRDGHFSINNAPVGDVRITVETESMRTLPDRYVAIPAKYNNVADSGLKATITKGQPEGTKLTFELKSK
jgi:hypothetical protein